MVFFEFHYRQHNYNNKQTNNIFHRDVTCRLDNFDSGTPEYISPELWKSEITKNAELYKYFDLWAFGATLFILFTSRKFIDENKKKDIKRVTISLPQKLSQLVLQQYKPFTTSAQRFKISSYDLD
jgi:serine/threonine protein kinase